MSQSPQHHGINYIEFTSTDLERSKRFYEKVFGWNFQDYGPDYISFDPDSAGIAGGFARVGLRESPPSFAPLVVLYSKDLKATEAAILTNGGDIVVATFEFPGGRRFHFNDGSGNILAVWSE